MQFIVVRTQNGGKQWTCPWFAQVRTMLYLSSLRHQFFSLSLRPSRPPSLSLATTTLSAVSFSSSYTLSLQQRRLHSSPFSFAKRVRSNSKPSKVAMGESSSTSKTTRRQREPAEKSDSAPPAKKPMYSIFEKKTDNPSEPAQVRWKTNGKSFIVGEAFNPQPGVRVAGFDLVCFLLPQSRQ